MALCMGDNRVGDTSDLLDLPQEMGLARRGSSWRLRLESSLRFVAVAHPNCVCSAGAAPQAGRRWLGWSAGNFTSKGEKWKLEDKVDELLAATASILNEDGFLILNTYSPTVDQETLKELMTIYFPPRAASADGLHMKTTSGKHLYFGELVRVGKTI